MSDKSTWWSAVPLAVALVSAGAAVFSANSAGKSSLKAAEIETKSSQMINDQNVEMERLKNQSEVSTQMVDLAVSILTSKAGEDNKALRSWAVNIIKRYSDVEFPNDAASVKALQLPDFTKKFSFNKSALGASGNLSK